MKHEMLAFCSAIVGERGGFICEKNKMRRMYLSYNSRFRSWTRPDPFFALYFHMMWFRESQSASWKKYAALVNNRKIDDRFSIACAFVLFQNTRQYPFEFKASKAHLIFLPMLCIPFLSRRGSIPLIVIRNVRILATAQQFTKLECQFTNAPLFRK